VSAVEVNCAKNGGWAMQVPHCGAAGVKKMAEFFLCCLGLSPVRRCGGLVDKIFQTI
jgi:hypothetical protein